MPLASIVVIHKCHIEVHEWRSGLAHRAMRHRQCSTRPLQLETTAAGRNDELLARANRRAPRVGRTRRLWTRQISDRTALPIASTTRSCSLYSYDNAPRNGLKPGQGYQRHLTRRRRSGPHRSLTLPRSRHAPASLARRLASQRSPRAGRPEKSGRWKRPQCSQSRLRRSVRSCASSPHRMPSCEWLPHPSTTPRW